MKALFLAIAAALASIPRRIVRWCARARDFIVEMLPAAPAGGGLTTAAGLEAEEAVNEVQEAREEAKLFKPSTADIVLRWAACVVSGSPPPDVSECPVEMQEWLADLETSACRAILRCESKKVIERHLAAKYDSDHIAGVPSYGVERPYTAPAVGYGSKRGNADAIRIANEVWDDILSGISAEEEEYA